MSCLDPNNFSNINDLHQLIEKSNFFCISITKKIDNNFSANDFMVDMKDFPQKWVSIKTLANYEIKDFSQEDELENIELEENYKRKKEDLSVKLLVKIVLYAVLMF